jgi:ABC-type amino acid transport substrate-binding protein
LEVVLVRSREKVADVIRVLFPVERLETIHRGKLTVGYSGEHPTDWIASGRLAGVHGGVATRVAEMLGLDLEVVRMPWPSMLPAVQARRIDVPGLAASWTEDRGRSFSFTQPFQYYFLGVMQPRDSEVLDVEDLRDHKVGVIAGCWNNPELEAFLGSQLVVSYKELPPLVEDVISGRIEFGIYDLPNIRWMLNSLGDGSSFHVLPFHFSQRFPRTTSRAPVYLVFDKEAVNLRTASDLALDFLKTSGELQHMYAEYGFGADDLLSMVGPLAAQD